MNWPFEWRKVGKGTYDVLPVLRDDGDRRVGLVLDAVPTPVCVPFVLHGGLQAALEEEEAAARLALHNCQLGDIVERPADWNGTDKRGTKKRRGRGENQGTGPRGTNKDGTGATQGRGQKRVQDRGGARSVEQSACPSAIQNPHPNCGDRPPEGLDL